MMYGPPSQGGRPDRDRRWDDVAPPLWARLWLAVGPTAAPHEIAPGALGEYAILLRRRGAAAARETFPTVAAHLGTGCASCAADLADLLAFAEGEEQSAPTAARGAGAGAPEAGLMRVFATRVGPALGGLSPGLRGAAPADGDLPGGVYQSGDVTVVLQEERQPRRESVTVQGVVMVAPGGDASASGGEARLLARAGAGHAPEPARTEPIDETGDFVLEDVSPGVYRLELILAGTVVVVDDLRVGQPPDP
jgi:hypothetical protein